MVYRVPAFDDRGDPVELILEFCWRCGLPVNVMLMSVTEHVDVAHPLPEHHRTGVDVVLDLPRLPRAELGELDDGPWIAPEPRTVELPAPRHALMRPPIELPDPH